MKEKKLKYRRLQVQSIAARTVIEIVLLITAIVISCTVVINSYEKNYAAKTVALAEDSAKQLAHSITGVIDADSMSVENYERREYVQQRYAKLLKNIFISEDVQYSGAVYAVNDENISFFAGSSDYSEAIDNADGGEYSAALSEYLQAAANGDSTAVLLDDIWVALEPVCDDSTGRVFAVSAAAVNYRASAEYDNPVKDRLVLISVVSGVLILAYFAISGVRSEKKKINSEAV